MRFVLLVLSMSGVAYPQSCSVTAPAPGQILSGTGFTLQVACTNLPALASVEYMINSESAGVTTSPPYSLVWDTYYAYNGAAQSLYAVARDATGATLATTATVSFSVANPLPQPTSQLSCTYTVPSAPWSGTETITVSCTGTNVAHHKSFIYFVDGLQVCANTSVTSSTNTCAIDSTQFLDGNRKVVVIVEDNDTGQPSGAPQDFGEVGQWEGLISFLNGATPILEIRADAHDVFLNLTTTTTHQIMVSAIHCDGSTTTPSATYSTNNSAIATVTAGGLVTAQSLGVAQITVTSGTETTIVWINVLADLTKFYHFGSDGTLLNTYDPAKSMLLNSMFFSLNGLNDPNYTQAQFAADYKAGGWNAFEIGITGQAPVPPVNQTQSAFQSAFTSYMTPYASFASTYGLKIHLLGDNLIRQNNYGYMTSRGPGTTFSPQTAVEYVYSQWQASGVVVGVAGDDEVSGAYNCCPQQGQIKMGTNGLTQIVASSGVCTASLVNNSGAWLGAGDKKFIIDGSVTSGMNSTPGVVYTITSNNSTTTIFNCPSVANGTYNSSNDPNLTIQQYADQWYDSTGAATTVPANAVDYARYDQMIAIQNQVNTVSPRPMIGWPPGGGNAPDNAPAPYNTLANWSAYGDYSEVYTTYSLGTKSSYLPTSYPLQVLATSVASTYRRAYSVINRNAPFICEPSTVNNDYGFQGYPVSVTSFSGNLITFSAPHGISTVLDADTRLTLTGQSNSSDNGNYWVRDCPTATTCHVFSPTTISVPSHFGGTLTYSDGSSFGVYNFSATNPGNSPINASITATVDPTCAVFNKRGQTVTVSGTSTALDGAYYASFASPAGACTGLHNVYLYQIPNGSSTGGTASITPDNNYLRGRNMPSPGGNEIGPVFMFANVSDCYVVGAAGVRDYTMYSDANSFNAATGGYSATAVASNTVFNDAHAMNQEGAHPHWTNGPNNASGGNAMRSFEAPSNAVRLYNRLAKLLLQPRQNAPDLGPMYDTSVRAGSNGQLILVQSINNGTAPRTVSLAPLTGCGAGGQPIVKYYATWTSISISTIAAGTATDSDAGDQGSLAAYACFAKEAGEYAPPLISVRLADVSNASSVAIRYNYSRWLLASQTTAALSCGSGTCTLPVDRNIGTVYYQLIYLDAAGRILATSDIQSL